MKETGVCFEEIISLKKTDKLEFVLKIKAQNSHLM